MRRAADNVGASQIKILHFFVIFLNYPRTNWRSTVNKDLLRMGITWAWSSGGSSKQIRMASECGPPNASTWCGLNHCQGQGQIKVMFICMHIHCVALCVINRLIDW